ncbi:SusC/RagA family TonB-linked outer membrane protein [Flavicella marina]|uniref:SusC/RagA family TonB-linked outer membrane protein n=1 Tax=Flavicella marina TaxID=1475951 RepID=UPI001D006BEC|nr:TonB-dependent receptor [Flavicella marina]
MNKKYLFSIGILCLMSFSSFAQTILKGKVIEQSSGEGLPGVSVIIKGTATGTSTDFDGNFELNSSTSENVLVFSYVGFKTIEQAASANQDLTIYLEDDSQALDEVVVVGYGTARKKDLTGSVAVAGVKDFNPGPVVAAPSLIQGKVAGVVVTTSGGAPGDGQEIRIRGNSSLSLTNNPLIVIDGVPMNDGGVGGSRNILNSVNPNDILNMTVLKDASSTAIFGSRAANGVIMITTKKGHLGQETKVSFNSSVAISQIMNKVSVLNTDQFTELVNSVGTPAEIARLGGARTDWQEEIYQEAISTENNVSVSGSLKEVPYRFSAGYTDTNGILKTDNMKRTTAKLTLTPQFFDDHLKVAINANASFIKNNFANRDAIGSAVGYDPTQPIYDANSKYGGYSTWFDPATGNKYNLAPTNPMALLNLKEDKSDINRLIANAKLDYKMHFLPELSAVLNVGVDASESNGSAIVNGLMPASNSDFDGSNNTYNNKATNSLVDFYLNYNKDVNEDHSFGLMTGYSYQKFDFNDYSQTTNYLKSSEDNVLPAEINKSRNVLVSFFGRANYNYKDKYLLTATLRADASSKLNPDDRWGYFPSAALAWNVTNEEFLKESKVIDNLKVRVGYGQVGNVNGLGDYQFITRYNKSINGASYQFGDSFYQTYRPEPINENLKWEIGTTFNAGIDYSILNGRIYGSIDAYNKITKDLIINSAVDPFTNFANSIDSNVGDMENRGIEFVFNTIPVRTEDWKWTIGFNLAYNVNTITRMPDTQNVGGISGGTNNTVQRHQEGKPAFSYYVYEQVYDEQGKPLEGVFVDRTNDGIINDEDRYFYKDPNADITMGLNTNLNYKNWDLSVVTRASFGNYNYNNTASSLSYEKRATENNILSNLSTDYLNSGFEFITDTNLLSDYYVRDASFFKIDNITLGYTLPKFKKFDKLGLRFFGSVQNALIVTDYDGLDPEISGGIDDEFYPRPRTFMLGLNANF